MELQFNPDNPDYEYIVDQKRAEEVLEKLAKEKVIAVDIEGSGLDPYTSSLFLIRIY